jgi:hypothetical protein
MAKLHSSMFSQNFVSMSKELFNDKTNPRVKILAQKVCVLPLIVHGSPTHLQIIHCT